MASIYLSPILIGEVAVFIEQPTLEIYLNETKPRR